MSEFRYNKLTKDWVLFAPNRAKRPSSYPQEKKIPDNSEHKNCPFEEGNENLTPNEVARIGDEKNWRCRIVPNLYHALSIDEDFKSYKLGCFENKTGFGAHEVIIETPKHDYQMFDFTIEEFFDYFSIIKLRMNDLKKDIRLKYFSVFKNFGENGGATLEHAHSQLIAMPFIPKTTQTLCDEWSEYKKESGRDFFDDLIYEEQFNKTGILYENNHFIAYCPYASQYPFEILIISKEQISSVHLCDDINLYSLSEAMQFCFSKLQNALGACDFNMLIKNGLVQDENNPNRLHIQILPRLYRLAGYELDTEIRINTFLPNVAAKILKES